MTRGAVAAVLVAAGALSLGGAGAAGWSRGAAVPVARTEVAAARFGNEIAVVAGFEGSGAVSARAEAYSPSTNRWRRLPDLPVPAHHATAAGAGPSLYVVGGYSAESRPMRTVFVLERGIWRQLRSLPQPRAAAAAAVVGGRLYVVGGVGANGLAKAGFALDLRTQRWSAIPGPTPREHLGAAAAGGRVYAVAGRTGGLDTNVAAFEAYLPERRRWVKLPPVPEPRGGTGAASATGVVLSVGGETPGGTIRTVYGYDVRAGRWRKYPDLPTPRHGLGVVGFGTRVHVLAGGPRPGLTVSAANEFIDLR